MSAAAHDDALAALLRFSDQLRLLRDGLPHLTYGFGIGSAAWSRCPCAYATCERAVVSAGFARAYRRIDRSSRDSGP